MKEGNFGMVMMDIGIFLGMIFDMEIFDILKVFMYKCSEMGYRKFFLYFDEVCVFMCYVIIKCIFLNLVNVMVI